MNPGFAEAADKKGFPVDDETLLANTQRLGAYIDDDTIPYEQREKRVAEYEAMVDEMRRREGDKRH